MPNEIKKKIEEWKFSSGALIMCLVAYSDGQETFSFQYVNKTLFTALPLTYSPVQRVLL